MKERFKNSLLTGVISINMDEHKGVWTAEKSFIVSRIISIAEEYDRNGDSLTLRQLYYQLVARGYIPNHDKVYKKISAIKDDIVYAGLLDWDIFQDRNRVPIVPYYEESVADSLTRTYQSYRLDRQKNQPDVVEVWTEKDAISGVLKTVTNKYGVTLVINKGYTSSSAIYDAYEKFHASIGVGKRIKILYFGDHDPSGLDMIRDIYDRLMFMFINGERTQEWGEFLFEDWQKSLMEISDSDSPLAEEARAFLDSDANYNDFGFVWEWSTFFKWHFKVIPVGLTMEQIKLYNPPENPAKITDPRASEYVKKYGKVSWEVDALKPDVMREIVRTAIEQNISLSKYAEILEEESVDRAKLKEFIDQTL